VTIDELIKCLEEIRDEHSGELPVLVEYDCYEHPCSVEVRAPDEGPADEGYERVTRVVIE